MAKNNWYIKAKNSNNDEIKTLIVEFDNTDVSDPKKDALKEIIKGKLENLENNPFVINEQVIDVEIVEEKPIEETPIIEEQPKEEVKEEVKEDVKEKNNSFSFTEEDIPNVNTIEELEVIASACQKEIKRIQMSELKHSTFKQKLEMNKAIWKIRRIMFKSKDKINSIRTEIAKQKRKDVIQRLNLKRTIFVNKYNRGISITNIVKDNQIKKEELKEIINDDVINSIEKTSDKHFRERWSRWKKMYL